MCPPTNQTPSSLQKTLVFLAGGPVAGGSLPRTSAAGPRSPPPCRVSLLLGAGSFTWRWAGQCPTGHASQLATPAPHQ